MEKFQAEKKSSKLGWKETTAFLNILLLVFLPVAASATHFPEKSKRLGVPNLEDLRHTKVILDQSELLRREIKKLLGEKICDKSIIVELPKSYIELKNELIAKFGLLIGAASNISDKEVINQVSAFIYNERIKLVSELSEIFYFKSDIVNLSEKDLIEIIQALIENEPTPFLEKLCMQKNEELLIINN